LSILIAPSSCVPAIKSGQSRETDNIGYTRLRGKQKRTIQRNWQHRVHKTKGQSKWTIQRNWQHRVHKTKAQSKVDNLEKLAA
jgi:hypothetical protein